MRRNLGSRSVKIEFRFLCSFGNPSGKGRPFLGKELTESALQGGEAMKRIVLRGTAAQVFAWIRMAAEQEAKKGKETT